MNPSSITSQPALMTRALTGALLAFALAPVPAQGAREKAAAAAFDSYQAFRLKHGSQDDGLGYAERSALFERRRAEVAALNARPGASWVAGLSRFADRTDEEFQSVLGYVRTGRWWERRAQARASSSFLEAQTYRRDVTVAESMDWRSHLNSSNFLRDQGQCGSCWAVAAVGALEMHAELRGGAARELSFEQLVDCVPNPQHCGGDGGCKGATAELGFEYVQKHGLAEAGDYNGYMSGGDGKCKTSKNDTTVSDGFERLATNKYEPLLNAVAKTGPVVVSVGANGWSLYQGGVFDGCEQNTTVNHAVLLVGYGTDKESGKDYWLIRNSWGQGWGEKGYIRLQRHRADTGDAGHCGVDSAPKEGVFCDGAPAEVPVCGMCGVLSDSSYPKNVHASS